MTGEAVRQVTPALVAGVAAGLRERTEIELADGSKGELLEFGEGGGASTVVLTRVRSSVAFIPALACRDRATTAGRPAELPAERWEETDLESGAFNRRYLLLSLAGQDPGLLRELFSPSLIAWLERDPPSGFSFELNEGFLTVALPGRLTEGERGRLVSLASDVSARIGAEIAEEGAASLDVFEEPEEMRGIERGLADVGFDDPLESVQEAIASAKACAGRKPASLLRALRTAVIAVAIAGTPAFVFVGPAAGVAAALLIGLPSLYVGWLVSRASYRWGVISPDRLGLEAWTRGYAESRSLALEDRWRFHGRHKDLPMPGFCDHVLAGTIPGSGGISGQILFLGDAAEMRATGQEIAFIADRPLAASAILAEAPGDLPESAAQVDLPEEYRIEIRGRQVLVWRPVQGNLLRTAAGTDRFCERAATVARVALEGGSRANPKPVVDP